MRRDIKVVSGQKIYIVLNRYDNGAWGIADFWHELPYASTSFKKAREYMNAIYDLAWEISSRWKKESFMVQKIELTHNHE